MRKRNVSFIIGLGLLLVAGAVRHHVVSTAALHIVAAADAPQSDVAIVLGAGMTAPGVPGPVLVDRLELALRLYEAGRVSKILVSGDNDEHGLDEVNPMRQWLIARGVPSGAVYMDHAGLRTHDTMQRAARVFGVGTALLCTQEFHLARSVYLARGAGIEAVGVAAEERRWRTTTFARVRETLAQVRAAADIAVGLEPTHLGDAIPIATAPARATHDRNTRG